MIDGFLTAFGWTVGIITGVATALYVIEKAEDAWTWIVDTVGFATWKC